MLGKFVSEFPTPIIIEFLKTSQITLGMVAQVEGGSDHLTIGLKFEP